MQISNVWVDPVNGNGLLIAWAKVELDEAFVIHGLKVLRKNGVLSLHFPNRKAGKPCDHCRTANHLKANYCNRCGAPVPPVNDPEIRYFHDDCHPITHECRKMFEDAVFAALKGAQHEPEQDRRSAGSPDFGDGDPAPV